MNPESKPTKLNKEELDALCADFSKAYREGDLDEIRKIKDSVSLEIRFKLQDFYNGMCGLIAVSEETKKEIFKILHG